LITFWILHLHKIINIPKKIALIKVEEIIWE